MTRHPPLARIGGDEFAVLCEGPDTAVHAAALAERRRTSLARDLPLADGTAVHLTASVGFAVADAVAGYDGLLARADATMYAEKDPGRGRLPA